MTRSICNSRCRMGLIRNIAAVSRIPVSEPNNPKKICHDQDDLLKHYKNKYEKDKRLFLQFMEHGNASPPSPKQNTHNVKRNSLIF